MPKCTNVSCLKNYIFEMLKMVNISACTFLSNTTYTQLTGMLAATHIPEGVRQKQKYNLAIDIIICVVKIQIPDNI